MAQCEGAAGWAVEQMIRRSLRRSFHTVYWRPPRVPITTPSIICANHHGWFDGYVMFAALTALGVPFLLWMEEFEAFPLFRRCGALPYPVNQPRTRASTIRQTIRGMKSGQKSLLLFPEGVLHRPGELYPFGRSLEFLADKVPNAAVVPVSIRYEASLHERPECFVVFGEKVDAGAGLAGRTREAIGELSGGPEATEILVKGTADVNERFGFKRKV